MSDTLFHELMAYLRLGASQKDHPFRYCTLGTVGLGATARLRTIVLRKVSEDQKLVFYTDKRSKKIGHIKENNTVSLLFYHPKELLQLKIVGRANIVSDAEELKKQWNGVQSANKKDYTTSVAPGSPTSNPDAVEYLDDKNYFCIVEIDAFKIEYLQLKHPNHVRVLFSKEDGNWNGVFLVP